MEKGDTRVAIVTGAAGGLGRMLVRAALDTGYGVGALDRDQRKLDELMTELAAENREHMVLPCCLNIAEESACNEAEYAKAGQTLLHLSTLRMQIYLALLRLAQTPEQSMHSFNSTHHSHKSQQTNHAEHPAGARPGTTAAFG